MKPLLSLPLFAIVMLAACKKPSIEMCEELDEAIECPYKDGMVELDSAGLTQNSILSFNMNNYWVYADTTWDFEHNFISAEIDTIKPIQTRITGTDIWWSFNGLNAIHQSNDSVYILATPDLGIGCSYKSLKYYPIAADTSYDSVNQYGSFRVRKTYIKSDITSTPAGDFSDCYFFSVNDESGDYYELLKPGIGFVKFKTPIFSVGYHEITLIDYHIEE